MSEKQSLAQTAVREADETIVDGIRVIRDALITVSTDGGALMLSAPLIEGKTVNEAADILSSAFEDKVPEESRRLARELVREDASNQGDASVNPLDVHWVLDSAVLEWEQEQKHTEFAEDPDAE